MFKNYLLVSLRNLLRNKIYSTINIFGLVIGTVASILILSYVDYETSYDKFFNHSENIYRITLDKYQDNTINVRSALTYTALSPSLKDFSTGIAAETRICSEECLVMYENEKKFNDQKILWVDKSFFDVFDFPFHSGSPQDALTKPNTAVITSAAAYKFFGNNEAVGKTVILNEGLPFLITGVIETLPENSHLKFDFLLSLSTGYSQGWASEFGDWNYNWVYTYVRLEKESNSQSTEKQINTLANEKDNVQKENNTHNEYHLQPLTSIHLDPSLAGELTAHGNRKMVYIMAIIGILILIIAWINFINLCTARAMERAKEAGIRKIAGASRLQLIGQFILESLIVNVIAGAIAMWVSWTLLPAFSETIQKPLDIHTWGNINFWSVYLAIFIAGSFISGIYPALVLSNFNPLEVLKSRSRNTSQGNLFRKVLVIFQFTVTIVLISSTLVIYMQFKHMQNANTGIDSSKVLVIKAPRTLNLDPVKASKFQSYREQIIKFHSIQEVCASNPIPGQELTSRSEEIKSVSDVKATNLTFNLMSIDYSYIPLYNLKLLAGRNYSASFDSDSTNIIINEKAADVLGFNNLTNAIGEKILFNRREYTIVGVVNNYQQEGVKKQVSPTLFIYDYNYLFGYYSVKLKSNETEQCLAFLRDTWQNNFPKDPFDYFFADEVFAAQFKQEQLEGKIFAGFTIIAITIACLGLLGLVLYTTQLRSKEISLRKIMGAPAKSLFFLLTKDLTVFIAIAGLIGIPIAYLLMSNWLNNYPYRIDLNPIMFLLPILILLIVALFSISYTLIKVLISNPIDTIRYE